MNPREVAGCDINTRNLNTWNCSVEDNDLKTFFLQNPNVQACTTTAKILLRDQDVFVANNIRFDDLIMLRYDDIDIICNALIDLH